MLSSEDFMMWSVAFIVTLCQMCVGDDSPLNNGQIASSTWSTLDARQQCSLWDQTGCQQGECCVKEVISFEDLDRNLLVSTICKPMLSLGELCLRESEGYLCDCSKGLLCNYKNNETYGHCVPGEG